MDDEPIPADQVMSHAFQVPVGPVGSYFCRGATPEDWKLFLDQHQSGDEYRGFRTADETWDGLCANAGVLRLRDGEPQAVLVLIES